VLDMLSVEGVGPKTAAAAWKQLGCTDLATFEGACREGRLAHLPRMGEARCRAIAEALERRRARQGRTPLYRALAHAEGLLTGLRKISCVTAAEAAGSLRRRCDTVGDIDLLVSTRDPERVMRALPEVASVAATVSEGHTKATLRLADGMNVDVRVVPPEAFGAALHYFTGSKTHNIALRTRAARMGIKLNEYGVFDRADRRIGGAREEDVFNAVGRPSFRRSFAKARASSTRPRAASCPASSRRRTSSAISTSTRRRRRTDTLPSRSSRRRRAASAGATSPSRTTRALALSASPSRSCRTTSRRFGGRTSGAMAGRASSPG
jgi:hypothetical protein